MVALSSTESSGTIKERQDKIVRAKDNWTMYVPLISAFMAMGPAVIALKESKAETGKEKKTIAKNWTKWHITSAVLGGALALIPAYFSYVEIKLRQEEKKTLQSTNQQKRLI